MCGSGWGNWVPRSTTCDSWSFAGGDLQCLAGAATTDEPGALVRGGFFLSGTDAGVFAVSGDGEPLIADFFIGFRCVR